LALLWLTLHDRYRAWKGFDWDVLNRLHERGFIDDPVNKTKSVIFTEEGLRESERLFNQLNSPSVSSKDRYSQRIAEAKPMAPTTPKRSRGFA
jgi:hypothetical protein